jgi:hypothetical protein
MGSKNARVLPLPVFATPITSLPDIIAGIACDWIGVGLKKLFLLMTSRLKLHKLENLQKLYVESKIFTILLQAPNMSIFGWALGNLIPLKELKFFFWIDTIMCPYPNFDTVQLIPNCFDFLLTHFFNFGRLNVKITPERIILDSFMVHFRHFFALS